MKLTHLTCLVTAGGATAGTGDQRHKLLPGDGEGGAYFGIWVSLSGTIAIVGSSYDDENGTDSGSAYLFDTVTGLEVGKLVPADGEAGDNFGNGVAIDGTIALIGAWLDDDKGVDAGSAYAFDTTNGAQLSKLLANDGTAGDLFATSVGLAGTTALMGARHDDDNGTDSGSAYLFDAVSGQQLAKLLPGDGSDGDQFGWCVAIDGTTAVIGAPFDDDLGTDSGAAYLFDTVTGLQMAKLLPADGAGGDWFGESVAIHGTLAIIGARQDDDNGTDSGSAYLFDTLTGLQLAKLTAADGSDGDGFGESVGISGRTAVVGAWRDDDSGGDSGSAYLFDTITGQQLAKLVASDGAGGDWFGESVAISDCTALVGAYLDDDSGTDSGSAYLFDARGVYVDSVDISRARYDSTATVTISGCGFAAGGTTTVLFDADPATGVTVVDDATITCDAPAVEPGRLDVDLSVSNANGSDTLADVFTFTPALQITGDPTPGGTITLTYLCDPGDSLYLIYGPPPLLSIPTPPYAGNLGMWPFFKLGFLLSHPFDTYSQNLTIPGDPTLSGLQVLFQGLVGPKFGGHPKDAAWTNVWVVDIA